MRDIALSSAQTASESEAEAPRLNRRQAAKVRTRQKVLDAARALFAERGYEPATIRDIAPAQGRRLHRVVERPAFAPAATVPFALELLVPSLAWRSASSIQIRAAGRTFSPSFCRFTMPAS
jgi:hypothetical protein